MYHTPTSIVSVVTMLFLLLMCRVEWVSKKGSKDIHVFWGENGEWGEPYCTC